jgi:hypothetical protein
MNGTKLTGLWKNQSKAGKAYLAGNLGLARIVIFSNDRKEKREDPDYTMWLVPKDDTRNGQGKNGKGKPVSPENGKSSDQDLPEDVPF